MIENKIKSQGNLQQTWGEFLKSDGII